MWKKVIMIRMISVRRGEYDAKKPKYLSSFNMIIKLT